MLNGLINQINSYFDSFPYEVAEQNQIIDDFIKEKNKIVNNEKQIVNSSI